MRLRPLLSWRGWVPATALSLLSFGCASDGAIQTTESREPTAATESWADEVDPQDVRVLGTVAEVSDETFTLKTFGDDSLYLFEIPSDPAQRADVRTGTEVQVWYDPEGFERDGNLYYRASRIETAEADAVGVETGERAELSASAEVDVDATAEQDLTAEEPLEPADSERYATTEDAELDELDVRAENELADDELRAESLGVDEPATQDDFSQDELAQDELAAEQTLPQTAGTLPLVALGGLLALFGAVALRLYRW